MSDYKTIHGVNIRDYTTDPDNLIEGQVWFDKTAKALQYQAAGAGAWASGGNVNDAKDQLDGTGTYTSSIVAGGNPPFLATAETYNGSSWTEVADLNQARRAGGMSGADATSALMFGGLASDPNGYVNSTEVWNGSGWTEVNNLNSVRGFHNGTGTATAALCIGHYADGAINELWNGTSWTEVNDLNTGRSNLASAGITTTALAFGGFTPPGRRNENESWNGTSWTELANLNEARLGLGGTGTNNTAALAFGGSASPPGSSANTEKWNGTAWTEVANLSTSRVYLGSSGTITNALGFAGGTGGPSGSDSAVTEEWEDPVLSVKTADTD